MIIRMLRCLKLNLIFGLPNIKSFSQYPELRFDIANGITLCIECHEKVHGRKIPILKTKKYES
jgi:hypothetical protein